MTGVRTADDTASGGGPAVRRALTARRIAELVGGELEGDPEALADHVAPIDHATPGSLTFLGTARYAPAMARTAASVVLVTGELRSAPGSAPARIVVSNPLESMLVVLPVFYPVVARPSGVDGTARIARGARIGSAVSIGAYVVIGAGAVVGDGVVLEPHVVLGDGVHVGAGSQLFAGVTVYPGSTLGERVVVHAGARIGSDGFGFVFQDGQHRKIPHVGRCIIEDDVEIGANTAIDRGSIGDTVIGTGTRIDNLVHIAHNVRIGRACLVMAQVAIAGSSRIGDGCVLAGQAGVAGHCTIGAGARVAGQAGVFGDIPAGETWSGYPARPHRESLRSHAALLKLAALMRRLERLLEAPR